MAAGRPIAKADIDRLLGDGLYDLRSVFVRLDAIKDDIGKYAVADLVSLGYSSTEAQLVKDAVDDITLLLRIFRGADVLAAPKDFRTNVQKLWGLGISA